MWVALPEEDEESEPFFSHYDESVLPLVKSDKATIRVLIGEAFGVESGVKTHSPTLYVEVRLEQDGRIALPDHVRERAAYVVDGKLQANGTDLKQHEMAIFDPSAVVELVAVEAARLVIIGGEPLGKRTVWWNLVSSRKERIEQAKRDWQRGRFPRVPEETEFIPLPE